MQKEIQLFPSLVEADPLHLGRVIEQLEPLCAGFHVDIMDNHFVPNLTWGPRVANAIAQASKKEIEVHLMVQDPVSILDALQLKAGDLVIFHVEVPLQQQDFIARIKSKGYRAGVAISPRTKLETATSLLAAVDVVLLMSVEPGFSGQSFLSASYERLTQLVQLRTKVHGRYSIAMDGGISVENIARLAQTGCERFAIGSALFGSPNVQTAARELIAAAGSAAR